jgi:hypothetical protein
MFRIIRTAALAAVLGIGAMAATPSAAEASTASFSFGFGSGSGAFSVQIGPGHRDHGRYHHRRYCSDRQALSKARDMGLRNARVARASHRNVEIRGWSRWRGHQAIVFSRAPHCPIVARY